MRQRGAQNTRQQNGVVGSASLLEREGFTETLSIYLSPPVPNSPLQNPSNFGATASIGYFTFYYFSFFLIFNRMDAWSLMRGDAFIHFVCGSRRVNIRLGVLLLIPKSPQILRPVSTIHFNLVAPNIVKISNSGEPCGTALVHTISFPNHFP